MVLDGRQPRLAKAQFYLGYLHEKGEGVPANASRAFELYREAAEEKKGHATAANNNLAYMYYNGKGVPIDFFEAAKWTHKVAEQGYATAQTDLGYLYEQGKGVSLDYSAAYMWYVLGQRGGDPRAVGRMKTSPDCCGRTRWMKPACALRTGSRSLRPWRSHCDERESLS